LSQAHATVDLVLKHVIHHHFNNDDFLVSHMPNRVPVVWKNAIIGLLDKSIYTIIDVPLTDKPQFRIRKSLEFAITRKHSKPGAIFLTLETGNAWQDIVDEYSFDIQDAYLDGCSKFPAHLSANFWKRKK
jgi:hypothetical protein